MLESPRSLAGRRRGHHHRSLPRHSRRRLSHRCVLGLRSVPLVGQHSRAGQRLAGLGIYRYLAFSLVMAPPP